MNAAWAEELGRSYYHFVYRDVLFLVLNSEDSQARIPPELAEGYAEYARLTEVDPGHSECPDIVVAYGC